MQTLKTAALIALFVAVFVCGVIAATELSFLAF